MVRRAALLLVAVLLAGCTTAAVAGPDCRKTPQAGPCQTPTPTPTPTPSNAPPVAITTAVQLAAWLQALPSGSTANLTGRTFTAETGGKVTGQTGLTVVGGSLVRTLSDPNTSTNFPNPLLWLYQCTRCTVQGMTFRGNDTTSDMSYAPEYGAYLAQYEMDAALRVESFTDATVTGVDVDGVWGDGIQLQNGDGATVTNTRIDRVGRQGVTILASRVLVDGVQVLHGRRSGFDLEPDFSTTVVAGIEIRNSFARTIGLPFTSAGRGQVNDVWIHGNTSAGGSVPVLYVRASDGSRRHDWRFEDHTALDLLGSPQAAVFLVNVDNAAVRRVRIPLSDYPTTPDVYSKLAVGFSGCGGTCEVTGNDFSPGGLYYYNRSPQPGQVLLVSGNTPALTETP